MTFKITSGENMNPTHANKNGIRTAFTVVGLWLLALSFSHGQGTVQFNNRITGTLVTHVYGPDPSYGLPSGNSSIDTPAGSTVYTGNFLSGSGWTAQLWSAPGTTANQADLVASIGGTSTFRTGTAAGSWAPTTATLANVAEDASAAVLQVRVFPTSYGTWANALAAYQSGDFNAQIGASQMFVVYDIGGQVNTPPILMGLTSFSIAIVPEPTTATLASLVTICFLSARRHRTQD